MWSRIVNHKNILQGAKKDSAKYLVKLVRKICPDG